MVANHVNRMNISEQSEENVAFYKASRFLHLASKSLDNARVALAKLPNSPELTETITATAQAQAAVGSAITASDKVGEVEY